MAGSKRRRYPNSCHASSQSCYEQGVNGPWALLSLGFLLGMRHATDSDHVVAVTTLISRERRVGAAALLGVLWGLGHTATLMAVGIPVVLFGLVIPERLGLSLEFSVALMLM